MLDKELLREFCTYLNKNTGLYYPEERWHDLEKKIIAIKSSFGFEDTAACLKWLIKNPLDREKLDILTFHLTIGETYFFRDRHIFATLEQKIIPDIVRCRLVDRSIRVWSVGCSTGEEPYSIAILLHRLIPDIKNWKVFILGSDINPEFLLKAKRAEYKKWSFRTTPQRILEKYFNENEDQTFTLRPEIQKMVNFSHLNLADDAYPNITKNLHEMDLIFCHNVLIYFSQEQINKTVHKLAQSLCQNGWLSVTAIEIPFIKEASLHIHKYHDASFFKKESFNKINNQHFHFTPVPSISHVKKKNGIPVLSMLPKSQVPSVIATTSIQEIKKEKIFDKCLALYQQKAYSEVLTLLQPFLAPYQNDSNAIKEHSQEVILLIRAYANQGDLLSALAWSERAIEAENLNPILHYLQATLLQDQGNILEAIKSVKRALFIDSNFMMAYLMLGILEKQQGNKKAALRNLKIALDLIDNHFLQDILSNPEGFSKDYLKDLISNNLKNL